MGKGKLRRDTSMLIFKWMWPVCAALLNSHWKGNTVVFYQFPLSILHCIRIPHQEPAVFHLLNSKYMGHLVMWRFSQESSCHPLFFFIQVLSCGKPQSKWDIHVEGEERAFFFLILIVFWVFFWPTTENTSGFVSFCSWDI